LGEGRRVGTAWGSDNLLRSSAPESSRVDQELFFREPGTPQPEHIPSFVIPAYFSVILRQR